MSDPNTNNVPIKMWAEDDRPREKLISKGKSVLSDAELMAIMIGSGTRKMSAVDLAKHILADNKNDLNEIARLGVVALTKYPGIGEARAINIIAALELGRRRQSAESSKKPRVQSSADLFNYIQPIIGDLEHEEIHVILLNNRLDILRHELVSRGGITASLADVRVIMKAAIDAKATHIALCHNHPSGALKPSKHDQLMTTKTVEAGRILDIGVIDHIIVTAAGYYSFADHDMLN